MSTKSTEWIHQTPSEHITTNSHSVRVEVMCSWSTVCLTGSLMLSTLMHVLKFLMCVKLGTVYTSVQLLLLYGLNNNLFTKFFQRNVETLIEM